MRTNVRFLARTQIQNTLRAHRQRKKQTDNSERRDAHDTRPWHPRKDWGDAKPPALPTPEQRLRHEETKRDPEATRNRDRERTSTNEEVEELAHIDIGEGHVWRGGWTLPQAYLKPNTNTTKSLINQRNPEAPNCRPCRTPVELQADATHRRSERNGTHLHTHTNPCEPSASRRAWA